MGNSVAQGLPLKYDTVPRVKMIMNIYVRCTYSEWRYIGQHATSIENDCFELEPRNCAPSGKVWLIFGRAIGIDTQIPDNSKQ